MTFALRMRIIAGTVLCGALWSINGRAAPKAVISGSEKFVVLDLRTDGAASSSVESTNKLIRVDPQVLAISAERVRQSLARQLRIEERGESTIRLALFAASKSRAELRVVSVRYADGWRFQLDVPDQVEPMKLIRATVQVLLLDYASGAGATRLAEIPTWLVEGLSSRITAGAAADLIVGVAPPGLVVRTMREIDGTDELRAVRSLLRGQAVATFAELSFPGSELAKEEWYRASAHLFVQSLGALPAGQFKMRRIVQLLPEYRNWQSAFLQAYAEEFRTLLDVEKWWSLVYVAFSGNDSNRAWTMEVARERLVELLTAKVEIRQGTNTVPTRADVGLQRALLELEYKEHRPILQQKVVQLSGLRLSFPVQLIPLVDRYRFTLATYLEKRSSRSGTGESKVASGVPAVLLVRRAVAELDELDRERERVLPPLIKSASTQGAGRE